MTDFWSSPLGEVTGSTMDAFAKTFTQIPDGTMALARIEGFINAEYMGSKYLSVDWVLTAGDFKGQKVNQKLRVFGDLTSKDSEKSRYRALNMLKLIYQLFNVKPKHADVPTNQDLAVFIGKEAGIRIRETEPNDEGKQYNWVGEVHSAKGFQCATGVSIVVNSHPRSKVSQSTMDSALSRNQENDLSSAQLDDDIPF